MVLRIVDLPVDTDVSEQAIGPIFQDRAVQDDPL